MSIEQFITEKIISGEMHIPGWFDMRLRGVFMRHVTFGRPTMSVHASKEAAKLRSIQFRPVVPALLDEIEHSPVPSLMLEREHNFNHFFECCMKVIGDSFDIPLEVLLHDFENSNRKGSHIKATFFHDAGAYGKCVCGRYSDDRRSITQSEFRCDCGELNGWSGSFKRPDKNAIWNES